MIARDMETQARLLERVVEYGKGWESWSGVWRDEHGIIVIGFTNGVEWHREQVLMERDIPRGAVRVVFQQYSYRELEGVVARIVGSSVADAVSIVGPDPVRNRVRVGVKRGSSPDVERWLIRHFGEIIYVVAVGAFFRV